MRNNYTKFIRQAFLLCLLAITAGVSPTNAQVINEGFEETGWTTSAAAGSSIFTITGAGTASINNGTWSGNCVSVNTNPASTITGNNYFFIGGSSAGYLITPVIAGGVSQVTLKIRSATGTQASLVIGYATNTTVTANTGSITSTGANNAWSAASSSYTGMPQSSLAYTTLSFSVTDANSTNPGYIKIQRITTGSMIIDDIVITGAVATPPVAPTTQASTINFTALTSSSMTINWTSGNGANRAVFMKDGSGTITNPVDGTTYTASSNWNNGAPTGTQLGTSGYYCMYNGSGSSVGVTNLQVGHTYYVQVFEYNGTGASSLYNVTTATGNPNNQAISALPTAVTGTAGTITTTGAVLNGTVNANGISTAVSFDHGTTVSYGTNVAGTPTPVTGTTATAVSATVGSLTANTLYHFRVNGTSTAGTSNGSDATFTTLPNAPTVGTGSAATASGFTANWTAPTGGSATFTYTLVYGTDPTLTVGTTTINNIASANLSQAISSLTASTTYYYKVQAVNTTGAGAFSAISAGITTLASVTVAPATALATPHKSDNIIHLTWTAPAGTYDGVLVFVRAAGAVNYVPTGAGASYTNANLNIGSAGVYNTDNYLVYSGTGTSIEVVGLSNTTDYYFSIVAYTGSTYATAATVNTTTGLADVTGFAATTDNAQSALSWTNPDFFNTQSNYWDEVVLVGSAGTTVSVVPTGNGSAYAANLVFGTGTDIGSSNFCMYKGITSPQTTTSLTNGTTHHFKAFVRHGTVWSNGAAASATPVGTGGVGNTTLSEQVLVYPNPVTDMLYINSSVSVNVTIKDLAGRTIWTGAGVTTVKTGSFAEGVYMIQVTDANGTVIKAEKLVKTK